MRGLVLVIPEITFSAGWMFLADKIGHFLKTWVNYIDVADHRLLEKGVSFCRRS